MTTKSSPSFRYAARPARTQNGSAERLTRHMAAIWLELSNGLIDYQQVFGDQAACYLEIGFDRVNPACIGKVTTRLSFYWRGNASASIGAL